MCLQQGCTVGRSREKHNGCSLFNQEFNQCTTLRWRFREREIVQSISTVGLWGRQVTAEMHTTLRPRCRDIIQDKKPEYIHANTTNPINSPRNGDDQSRCTQKLTVNYCYTTDPIRRRNPTLQTTTDVPNRPPSFCVPRHQLPAQDEPYLHQFQLGTGNPNS